MEAFRFLQLAVAPELLNCNGMGQEIIKNAAHNSLVVQWFVQVQWSSLRPTQLPLMCVELATSPSGVSMMVWGRCWEWRGSLGL